MAKDAVVLAFGDSLTYGTGAPISDNYPSVLSRLINRKVVTAGMPGELSADGLKRLSPLLEKHNPQLVIICHGANDLFQGSDMMRLALNIRAMVETARKSGAQVVLVGVPRRVHGGFLAPPRFYQSIARDAGVPYEGEILQAVLNDRLLRADPIHPNARGYRKLAEDLALFLHVFGAI